MSLVSNVFETCVGKEIHFSSNQVASRIVESLLGYSEPEILESFCNEFQSNFRPICSDNFASHVLQKLVEICFLRTLTPNDDKKEGDGEKPAKKKAKTDLLSEKDYNIKTEFPEKHVEFCSQFVVKVSKFVLNNLEDFVWDNYANHIIRTCVVTLAGIYVEREFQAGKGYAKKNALEKEVALKTTSEDWMGIILEFVERLQLWPQFADFPYDELSSGLLQYLCVAARLADKSALKSLGKKILNQAFLAPIEEVKDEFDEFGENKEKVKMDESEKSNLAKVFTKESSIRLLEVLLGVAGAKLFTQLYAMLFCGRLKELSDMKSGNFTVQKLLESSTEKVELEAIFDELSPNIENMLQIGHTGVVLAMALACLRLSAKQGAFIQSLQTALHCLSPKERADKTALLILKLKPYEIAIEDKSNFVHLHGSVILQTILKFNKPIKLIQSLMEIKNDVLAAIFCTPIGSHVVDAFVQSKFIGEKSREKLIYYMQGTYLDLAISKGGSRAFEALFEFANDKQKDRMMTEISQKNQLESTLFGRIISLKYRVEVYNQSPVRWKAEFGRKNKVENIFKDIV